MNLRQQRPLLEKRRSLQMLFLLRDWRWASVHQASLSSCVQMRGPVRGRAASSTIPTITVTRHQSVSKHVVAPPPPPPPVPCCIVVLEVASDTTCP